MYVSGMSDAGIDVERFQCHSSRGAKLAADKTRGASLSQLLKSGGWRSLSTYKKYYLHVVEDELEVSASEDSSSESRSESSTSSDDS